MALLSMTREDFEAYDAMFDEHTDERIGYVSWREKREQRRNR